jgi:hypothetical protein
MTENQWPQDETLGTPPANPYTAVPQDQTYSSTQGSSTQGGSKADAVKGEAGEVTRQAGDAARNVAQTAKSEAANVASEAKYNAQNLLHQARTGLTDQAGTQQQKVAQGLRSISDELRSMAGASNQPGMASDLVRQAAERSSSLASWLEGRDPGSLLDEVKYFARRRPGAFLLIAAGAGMLAGRVTRGLTAGATGGGNATGTVSPGYATPTYGAVPPPPVQTPADTTTAGLVGSNDPRLGDPTLAGRAGAGQPGTYPSTTLGEPTSTTGYVDDPLAVDRPLDEPYNDDPYGGRR